MESRKLLKGIKMKEYLYVNSEYLKICIQGLEKLKKHYKKQIKGVVLTEEDEIREDSIEIMLSAFYHGQEILKKLLTQRTTNDTN